MKYLIFFLISFSVFANYIPSEKVGKCESLTVFTSQAKCQEHYGKPCSKIPFGYNCEYFEFGTEDDLTKPIYSKNQITVCEENCAQEFDDLICLNPEDEKKIGEAEVYCQHLEGYEQKATSEVVVNESKKAAYEAAQQAIKQKEELRKTTIETLKADAVTKSYDQLSIAQKKILMGLVPNDEELGI